MEEEKEKRKAEEERRVAAEEEAKRVEGLQMSSRRSLEDESRARKEGSG